MIKINIIYNSYHQVAGYIIEPLDEKNSIEITEYDFIRLKKYLGEEI